MHKFRLSAFVLAATVALSACSEQIAEPTSTVVDMTQHAARGGRKAEQPATTNPFARVLPVLTDLGITDQRAIDQARCAINADDYVCTTTTIQNYYLSRFYGSYAADPVNTLTIYRLYADYIPMYDALYYQTAATPQYFGNNGEYTEVMVETDRDIRRFWDIFSDDIQLIGMHGSMLTDIPRSARVYRLLASSLGLSRDSATYYATQVANAIAASPTWNGGNHPFLTFNAFAISFGLGDKIVMGDGILEAYAALGFADVAPQAIFGHEFAHHIQFENGYFDDAIVAGTSGAEQTRYTELMADAMSAYYLTHSRGLAMNKHRVAQFLQVFFEIGDCAFESDGHHGTPNQRMRAAEFGFRVADEAHKQGHILTSEAFHARFVAVYPELIAPDAVN